MLSRAALLAVAALVACRDGVTASTDGGSTAGDDWPAVKARYGMLSTIAGRGASDRGNEWQAAFEGARAVDVELSRPHFAMADGAGNVYVADEEAHGIRRIAPDGRITTVAGTNQRGDGDDAPGPATSRALSDPNGLWVQPDGTLYVVDLGNAKIRKVTPAGVMSTLFTVPGGLGTGRGLWVAADEAEVVYAAGTSVGRWTRADGVRELAAGFDDLGMVVRDGRGRLLVADRGASRVYALAGPPGATRRTVIAGGGGASPGVGGTPALETALAGVRAVWPVGDGFFAGTHQGCQVVYVDPAGVARTCSWTGPATPTAGTASPSTPPGRRSASCGR